eukprot:3149724-Pleurochrysis_carterae.AAC.1
MAYERAAFRPVVAVCAYARQVDEHLLATGGRRESREGSSNSRSVQIRVEADGCQPSWQLVSCSRESAMRTQQPWLFAAVHFVSE